MVENRLGLVEVYTGDGKGKTTAALGLALRAVGHDLSVLVIQFLKGGTHIGELIAAKKFLPSLKIVQYGKICPYSDMMERGVIECGNCRDCFSITKDDKKKAKEALKHAAKAAKSGKYDIVILDEINNALDIGLITLKAVLKLIKTKDPHTELILTGRNAPKEIVDIADLVTEMIARKHPMNKGFAERRGMEY